MSKLFSYIVYSIDSWHAFWKLVFLLDTPRLELCSFLQSPISFWKQVESKSIYLRVAGCRYGRHRPQRSPCFRLVMRYYFTVLVLLSVSALALAAPVRKEDVKKGDIGWARPQHLIPKDPNVRISTKKIKLIDHGLTKRIRNRTSTGGSTQPLWSVMSMPRTKSRSQCYPTIL